MSARSRAPVDAMRSAASVTSTRVRMSEAGAAGARSCVAPAVPSQAAIAAALLDPDLPCPDGLVAWNGSDPAPRFAVHRNSVVASLVDALADTFPVIRRLTGDAFFRAMAAIHVRREPPTDPVLAHYGEGFAAFVAAFGPARSLPYLADLARLERARIAAYHAADVPPLGEDAPARALAAGARVGELRLRLHPSVTAIASAHSIVAIWAAHQVDEVRPFVVDVPEACVVLRDGDEVCVVPVPAAAAACVDALRAGRPLAEAAGAGLAIDPAFDPGAAIAVLVRHRALVGVELPAPAPASVDLSAPARVGPPAPARVDPTGEPDR